MSVQNKPTKQPHYSDIPELQALFFKAKELQNKEHILKHLALYRKIEKRATELNSEKDVCAAKTLLVRYYIDHKQYKRALKQIFETLPLAKKHALHERISNLYNWLAGIYMLTGDYSNALDFFQMEIDHNIKAGIEHYCFNAYTNMGSINNEIGEDKAAELFFMKAKALAEKYPDFLGVRATTAHLNTWIISLQMRMERYDEARKLCFETIKISKNHPDIRLMPCLYVSLSIIESDLGNYQKALDYALEAEKHLSKNDHESVFSVARAKAVSCAKLGKKKEATQSFRKVIKLNDTLRIATLFRLETLHHAAAHFEAVNEKRDLAKVQKILKESELSFQTMQAKLSLRAEQLIAFANKHAPVYLRQQPDTLDVHAIGIGKISLPVEKIYACQTEGNTKNVSIVYVTDGEGKYRVPSTLRCLYAKLNSDHFIWINKNAFVGKKHIVHLSEANNTGTITLHGHTFKVSRRNRKILLPVEIQV